MLKNTYLWPAFLSLLLVGCGQKENDLDKMALHGDVAAVSIENYQMKNIVGYLKIGDPLEDYHFQNGRYDFDEAGRIVSINYIGYDGELRFKITNEYEGELKTKMARYDSEGRLGGSYLFTYDGDIEKTCDEFDSKGKLSMKTEYRNDGKHVVELSKYAYSESFEYNLIMAQRCSRGPASHGILQQEGDSVSNRVLCYTVNFMYDGDKLMQTHVNDAGEDHPNITRYEYDGEEVVRITTAECVVEVERDADNLVTKVINGYVDNENKICISNENIFTYEYKFDEKNNWIERAAYSGEEKTPFALTQRTITYR